MKEREVRKERRKRKEKKKNEGIVCFVIVIEEVDVRFFLSSFLKYEGSVGGREGFKKK